MGEVYRARDISLGRDVALKVLPASLAQDDDRLARLQREARVLASLNHPNIAQIFGFEQSSSADATRAHALVMELIEGPTLADRIASGPIPLTEALLIARQVADALESAHEQGVVHRDLKPANIKVRGDGTVKVLDFGIAKAFDSWLETPKDALQTPDGIATLTLPGAVLGTPAYMSPEQAKGKAVDRRTDIWAFGIVLFEILTGDRAFGGDSAGETLAAVLTQPVDWARLPADTPLPLFRLLERCLDRDVKTRLRDIGEARVEIARIATTTGGPVVGTSGTAAIAAASSRATRWLAASLAVVSTALVASVFWPRAAAADLPLRLAVTFPDRSPMQLGQSQPSLAFSPDGRLIVYSAVGPEGIQLWKRDINAFAPQAIAGTAGGRQAFFSPDGAWIGFMTTHEIKKMPISLSAPTLVCPYTGVGMGATWTTNDEIIFATRATAEGLWRVPAAGGVPVAITKTGVWYPDALPGGRAVVATMYNETATESVGDLTIAAISLKDGAVTRLFDGGTFVRYSPTGHLIYLRNNSLMASPFNAEALTVSPTRAVVIDPVFMDSGIVSGNFAISAAGALAYAPGDANDFKRTIASVERSSMTPLVNERRPYRDVKISPDGKTAAVVEQAWRDHIWLVDMERQSFKRLTTGRYLSESAPVWSPDGRRVAFRVVSDDSAINLFVAPADGTGNERLVFRTLGEVMPETWTADGRSVILKDQRNEGNIDLALIDIDGPPNLRPLIKTAFNESGSAMSPDGRWLAYHSNRSGKTEVYVTAYPALAPTIQVSTQGGLLPVWARDGQRLFFRQRQDVMAVTVITRGPLAVSTPVVMGTIPPITSDGSVSPTPDGRLIGIDGAVIGSAHELRIVLNWFSELRERAK